MENLSQHKNTFAPPDVSVILDSRYMLDALLTLKNGGSLTEAANQVNKSRSTLNEKLTQVEKKLGFVLYDRKGALTNEGEYIVDRLEESRRLIQEAAMGMRWLKKEIKEEVMVCAAGVLAPLASKALTEFILSQSQSETHYYIAGRPESVNLNDWTLGRYDGWLGNIETLPEELKDTGRIVELKYPKVCYWCDADHPLAPLVADDGKIHANVGVLAEYPCLAPSGIPFWWEVHWRGWLFDMGIPLGEYRQTSPLHVYSSNDDLCLDIGRKALRGFDGGIALKRDFLGDRVVEIVLDDEPEYTVGKCFVAWRKKENPKVEAIAEAIIAAVNADNDARY